MIPKNNIFRLVVLMLIHFTVDFYGGLIIPLPEPTLTRHLGVNIGTVALMLGIYTIVANLAQPLSGWILPKKGAPILLLIGPFVAALVTCIGLTSSLWTVNVMLFISAVGVGIIHPEGTLIAYNLSDRYKGLGMSLFLSAGYLGYSSGSLVSGLWVEYYNQELTRFWLLALPVLCVAVLILLSGLHRLEGHKKEETISHKELSFIPVLALSACLAINMSLLVRFITIFFVRSFPGQNAQGWGGTVIFVFGISAIFGSFLWGYLSERFGCAKLIFATQFLLAPFLYKLLHVSAPSMASIWAIGVGFTIGAVIPLCMVLARQSRGLSNRLRMGIAIGGSWIMGDIAFILGGKYIALFGENTVKPVVTVLNMCWIFLIISAILAAIVAGMEKRVEKNFSG
jgi:MFS family permease